jgi:outer membrane biosynthesis protein TonB
MLNATLCATGRAICCLLENYQEADGVRIPEVLVPFMGGITFLPFVRDSKAPDRNAATATINPPKKAATTPAPAAAPAAVPPAPAATEPVVTAPPAAPEAAKEAEKPKKEEKEKKPKEKKEKVAAPAAPPAPVFVTTPDVIKPPPSYVTNAPTVSTQDYSQGSVAGAAVEEDEIIPSTEDVLQALGSDSVLAAAESRLFYYNFVGGDLPTQADVRVWDAVKDTATGNQYPNVARWLRYVNASTPATRATWA